MGLAHENKSDTAATNSNTAHDFNKVSQNFDLKSNKTNYQRNFLNKKILATDEKIEKKEKIEKSFDFFLKRKKNIFFK